jgi:hypothetical protein
LIVGDHQSVKRRFGIWLRPERCAFVSFLYFIDSSKPEACVVRGVEGGARVRWANYFDK